MDTFSRNQKVVRGVNIAAFVIAIILTLCSLFMISYTANQLEIVNDYIDYFTAYSYYGYYYSEDLAEYAAEAAAWTALFGLSIVALIASAFQIFVSIFTIVSFKNHARLQSLFVLAIIAAVSCVIIGGIIELPLFIVSAVFLHKLKNESQPADMAAPAPAPVAPVAPAPVDHDPAAPIVPPAPPAPGAVPVPIDAPQAVMETTIEVEGSVPVETVQAVEAELDAELTEAIAAENAADAQAEALGDAIAEMEVDQAVNGARATETDVITEVIATEAVDEVTTPEKPAE